LIDDSKGSRLTYMIVKPTVRVGDLIMVVGMVGRDEDGRIVEGVVAQTTRALVRVSEALQEHGCDLADVCRLRVYVTDIADWGAVADEITRHLGPEWPPAVAMQVVALVDPAMKVEIEVDAAAR
jgi:enamine deaminase RidA (YjgF/YER057c/UK114 family)